MRYSLFIVFLLISVSHGFFGSIGQTINNAGNTVNSATNNLGNSINSVTNHLGQSIENFLKDIRGHVDRIIRELLNSANELQSAANSLWDTVFSPAFDMLTQGGHSFLNDQFAAILTTLGRPIAVPENALSEKYTQLIARLKSNIHHLYENLFLMEKEALLAVENGEQNFEERIRAFYDKIDAIHKQINEWAIETKNELEAHARTVEGDWINILNQYNQNIDISVKTLGTLFQQLAHNLMRSLLEVVLSVVPNAIHIVQNMKEQGLLSFFHQ